MLEERLYDFGSLKGPEDVGFQYYVEYDLRAVERGKRVADLLKNLACPKGASVLDLGCGTGGFAVAFAQEGARVVGFDLDQSGVELAAMRGREFGVSLDLLISDGVMSPLRGFLFDVVICNEVFEHVASKDELAREIARLLKDTGIAYIAVPNGGSPWNILWDDHTGIPFINFLPRRLQNLVVRLAGLTSKDLPWILEEPGYGSLLRICSRAGLAVDDRVMRMDINNVVFHRQTDMLEKSRSNRYPVLTSTLARLLRWSYIICRSIGLSALWWLAMKLTYPKLTFLAKKSR